MSRLQKKTKIILLLFLLAGLCLRAYRLGDESLSVGEAMVAWRTSYPISDTNKFWLSGGHFPTYYIIMHYWVKLFGAGEFAVRFPSVIFGVISIYIIFLLGKKLFNNNIGLLTSYLFTVSTINIYYSQYARPYNMVVTLALLSFLFFFLALERNTKLFWCSYIFFTLLALLSSASTLPMLICQIIFMMLFCLRCKKSVTIKKAVFIFAAILTIYSPFLLKLIALTSNKTVQFNRLFSFSLPSLSAIARYFNLFGGKVHTENLSLAYNHIQNPTLIILTAIFSTILFVICLYGMFNLFKIKGSEATCDVKEPVVKGIFLSLWLWTPIIFLFIFSYLYLPVFGPVRYVLYISPAYYMLISHGLMIFRRKIRALLIVFIVIMGIFFLHEHYRIEKKINWRELFTIIKDNIRSDEKAAFIINNSRPVSLSEHIMLEYYNVPSVIGIKGNRPLMWMSKEEEKIYNKEVKMLNGLTVEELTSKGIWLVVHLNKNFEVIEKLKDKYDLTEKIEFYDAILYHFRIAK